MLYFDPSVTTAVQCCLPDPQRDHVGLPMISPVIFTVGPSTTDDVSYILLTITAKTTLTIYGIDQLDANPSDVMGVTLFCSRESSTPLV